MEEFMAQYGRYVWLAVSLLLVLAVDYAVTRLVMETVRPASNAAFWAGRAGKLFGALAWIAFFNSFWFPQYLGASPTGVGDEGTQLPDVIKWTEIGVVLAIAALGALTLPRGRREADV